MMLLIAIIVIHLWAAIRRALSGIAASEGSANCIDPPSEHGRDAKHLTVRALLVHWVNVCGCSTHLCWGS